MTTEQAPKTLPIPANFPVKWDTPEEAAGFWTVDLMHWPHGLSNLSATMDMPAFGRGLVKAADALAMPFKNPTFKHINGYVYNNFEPYSYDQAEMEARMMQMRGRMMQHIPGLLDRWHNEYEPEVRSINDETLNADYSKLGDRDIAELLEKIVAKREREGELHFLAVFPAMGAVMAFEEVYTNLIGAPKGGEHLQLLQGFPNKSTEAGDGLWDLAQEARRRPAVMKIIQGVPASDAHDALGATEEGRTFRSVVEEYTAKYGWRANELDIAEPTWKERPAPIYSLIREYVARDDYDPREEFRSLVKAREARERVLMDRLAGGPVETFRQFLAGAQQYLPIQEDHNFWIDQQGVCVQRVPVLEAGRRLVGAGRIADAQDVFQLYYDELQGALRGENGNLQQLVERRRQEREHFKQIAPPEALGTVPPAMEDDPMAAKFWGAPPDKHPDPRIMNGNAASAGQKTGTARVILTLDDADRLNPGEILVCPATMPPWTPLFGIASAVVTDHGGILSHTAIVAREYQIPAVVGTKVATSLIQDGATITVDGTAGTVKLEG
ncbi:MAG TPA: PEP-utilizing enzyme [Dehalococcoidia bacterium]|nr:PEP-utilizing enzyme [Dehalococcoidia bacterium]